MTLESNKYNKYLIQFFLYHDSVAKKDGDGKIVDSRNIHSCVVINAIDSRGDK